MYFLPSAGRLGPLQLMFKPCEEAAGTEPASTITGSVEMLCVCWLICSSNLYISGEANEPSCRRSLSNEISDDAGGRNPVRFLGGQ